MRIGFYSPYLDTFGGGERYMLSLASFLSYNHTVDIFWDDNSIKAPLSRFLKIDLSKTRLVSNIFRGKLIGKYFSTKKYDCIFVLSDGSVPFTFAKRNILHFQVPFNFEKLSGRTKLQLSKYNHIVCNSYFTKSFIDKSFHTNSLVIYPPVDIKAITPKPKENIILSVGRFSTNQLHPKKQEILIEVFKEIYKKESDCKLVLVGQAKKEDQKYVRHLKKISKGFAIRILDNLPVEKLRSYYGKSQVYWHATGFGEDEIRHPEKMEHFGISTVEASAAGCVPIVISKGGQKEIVIDGKNGLLWQTKSQLYEKTLDILENREKREYLSQNAVKNSKRFSQEIFQKAYEKILF